MVTRIVVCEIEFIFTAGLVSHTLNITFFRRISKHPRKKIDIINRIVYIGRKLKEVSNVKRIGQIQFPRNGFWYPGHGSARLRQITKN